jgi:thiosulfate/3-mercaptopyruvate sulfurtransferase
MGIDENTPVAVYGDADKSWGGEGWACWVLSWLGHKGHIRLLNGGIQAWRTAGEPVTTEQEKSAPNAVLYQVSLRPELDIQASELEKKENSMVLIDCRSTTEWLMGHIPGAIHIPWDNFYTGKDHRPLGPDALRKLLADHGIDASRPIVYYCAAGVRSSYTWVVHTTCGLPPARNYKGGMEEWKRLSR